MTTPIKDASDKEKPVKIFHIRQVTGMGECQICTFWMKYKEQVCITNRFRTVHVGCLAYEYLKERGTPWELVLRDSPVSPHGARTSPDLR